MKFISQCVILLHIYKYLLFVPVIVENGVIHLQNDISILVFGTILPKPKPQNKNTKWDRELVMISIIYAQCIVLYFKGFSFITSIIFTRKPEIFNISIWNFYWQNTKYLPNKKKNKINPCVGIWQYFCKCISTVGYILLFFCFFFLFHFFIHHIIHRIIFPHLCENSVKLLTLTVAIQQNPTTNEK